MKLLWSSRSPYVRKVMIVAHELGLADQLELVPVTVSLREAPLLPENPLGQIPVLVLDDGTTLYDSSVICDYLATLVPGRAVVPIGTGRFELALRMAQGNGLMDNLIKRYSERRRAPAGTETEYATAYRIKGSRMLDALDANHDGWFDKPFDVGHAAICGGLSYMDFRFDAEWRPGRAALARWFDMAAQRPSMLATQYAPVVPAA